MAARPRGEQLFELRRRTFDTPEFRGIEFIEVEAKSIINRVPGTFLPFKWTINPYRGCTHACSYCLEGDTPVLMADGRTKRIQDLRVGDEIYGTRFDGKHRRFVRTRVLAHWSMVKPAYRVTLEDGTQLVASGDHRFLSNRGWKHVTGTECGRHRRPHLTTSNSLLGTGRFADPPKDSEDYRRGYLCGMIRGDAHLGTYVYPRPGRRATSKAHRFRLALADVDALERTRGYLAGFGVPTREFAFSQATPGVRPMRAIRASSSADVAAIAKLIEWPGYLSDDWCKGFLAGIFDAEGSYGRGALRISNTNRTLVDCLAACLENLGFGYVVEKQTRANGLRVVRLLGGFPEALRFFHTVDPAIMRKRGIEGRAIKNGAKLGVVGIESLGIDLPMYDITTGTGDFIADGVVSHNCFARVTHTYMDMDAGKDFESKIVVKVNAPEVLRAELRSRRWKGEHIAMGTGTDPYQRAEGRYCLMPGILRALIDYRNPFSVLTKGTLILRDLDLLREAAREVPDVSTAFSVGTLDEEVWRRSEPGTPHPRARLDAVAELNRAGVPCGVLVAPILPGISDRPEQLRAVVEASIAAGATHVSPILLHLRPVVREEYLSWLREQYPDLVPRYAELYSKGAYAPAAARARIGRLVGGLVRSAGGLRLTRAVAERFSRRAGGNGDSPAPASRAQPEQLPLL